MKSRTYWTFENIFWQGQGPINRGEEPESRSYWWEPDSTPGVVARVYGVGARVYGVQRTSPTASITG